MAQVVRHITKEQKEAYLDKLKRFSKGADSYKQAMIARDASLMAYSLFRDASGNRLRLYAFQDLILNDKSQMIAVAISRQAGKSTLAVIKALHYIMNNDNATVLVISKTLAQSKELIAKLKQLINNSPLKAELNQLADGYDNKSEFYVKNKNKDTYSRIISVPATDAARGYSAHLVIADENAFWDNSIEMFNEAILPTVSQTNGTIMMLSTPKGQIGVFYEAFTKPHIWSCYQLSWEEVPHHTQEKMDIYKSQIGEFAFRQEYEASFEANANAYFTREEITMAVKDYPLTTHTSMPTVIGVDFGKKHDNTIVMIGMIENPMDHPDYQRIKVINIIEKPLGTDYNKVVGELKTLAEKYSCVNILYDATGVGEGPGDFMKDLGLPVEGIKFSIQSKINMYSNLKMLFEKKQIIIPNNRRLIDELCMFEYEYTTSGNMKLHHPEGGHDDSCFVAGTKVITRHGEKNIEDLKVGDLVLTRKGLKPIVAIGSRYEETINKISLTGTIDHPVILKNNKIEKLINVNVSDIITWKNILSNITDIDIIDIRTVKEDTLEFIFGDTRNGRKARKHFTEIFGKTISVKFLKDLLYITKMEIPLTTTLKILRLLKKANISVNTLMTKEERKLISKTSQLTLNRKQKNGMQAKKEENGTKSILKTVWEKLLLKKNTFVKNVKNNLKVKQLEVLDFVQDFVNKEIGLRENKIVYNLSIKDCNEYFANGVLVHNCDACALMAYGLKRPGRKPVSATYTQEVDNSTEKSEFETLWKNMGLIK